MIHINKIFTLVGLSLCAVACASAQPMTVRGTVSAGATVNNVYAAFGQPFFQQKSLGGYELSMGVAQAQWVRDTVYDVITYNTPYTKNGFDLSVPIESHKDSVYLINGGIYNYDLWRTLYLIVCPQYMASDYDVLAVSGYCWTKQNLRISADGRQRQHHRQHHRNPLLLRCADLRDPQRQRQIECALRENQRVAGIVSS